VIEYTIEDIENLESKIKILESELTHEKQEKETCLRTIGQ